jgi:hypothetical protein
LSELSESIELRTVATDDVAMGMHFRNEHCQFSTGRGFFTYEEGFVQVTNIHYMALSWELMGKSECEKGWGRGGDMKD